MNSSDLFLSSGESSRGIFVCDAIMGSGKTSAAIRYMNDHPEKRFLYITPRLSETERIVSACPSLDFWMPSSTSKEDGFSKFRNMKTALERGRNISLSHALFSMCDAETAAVIRCGGYTVLLDETMDALSMLKISKQDFRVIKGLGLIVLNEDASTPEYQYYKRSPVPYDGNLLRDILRFIGNRDMVVVNGDDSEGEEGCGEEILDISISGKSKGKRQTCYLWSLRPELFACAEQAIILTYRFEDSFLRCFLEMNDIAYHTIGVERGEDGGYRFSERRSFPEYVGRLSEMIHVCDVPKLNRIGDRDFSLSCAWIKRGGGGKGEGIDKLRSNLNSYFRYHNGDKDASRRLWSTYKPGMAKLRQGGFYRSSLEYNSRSVNNYGDKDVLAYCVNIFCDPAIRKYFFDNGIEFSEDGWALSTMLQWIWRSAIRNGREVWIYVPSKRMRNLLTGWIRDTENEYYENTQNKEMITA